MGYAQAAQSPHTHDFAHFKTVSLPFPFLSSLKTLPSSPLLFLYNSLEFKGWFWWNSWSCSWIIEFDLLLTQGKPSSFLPSFLVLWMFKTRVSWLVQFRAWFLFSFLFIVSGSSEECLAWFVWLWTIVIPKSSSPLVCLVSLGKREV